MECPDSAPSIDTNSSCTSDPAHTVSYAYTNNDRLLSVTDPDQAIWSYDYTDWVSLGEVTLSVPGAGSVTRSYDDDNRLTGVDYSDLTPDVSYDYSRWLSTGRVKMTDGVPGGTVAYTYDALGALTSVKRGTASGFTYSYFPDGSLTSPHLSGWDRHDVRVLPR